MRNALLFFMLAATGCIHAQVKPVGEGILDLETFGFDTKITDLYPDKNKNTFYTNGNVYNYPGTNDGIFERRAEKNGYKIFDDDVQRDVVVYRQIAYTRQPIARYGQHAFGEVNVMTTPDGRIAAVSATAHDTSESLSAGLVEYLTKRYGAPARMETEWDESGAPLYEWIGKDRIIRCVYAENRSAVLKVDLGQMQISQDREKMFDSHLFIIDPQLEGEVFPGGKRCTVSGNFVFMNEKID